jgi:type I site-specific restriction endonuclease
MKAEHGFADYLLFVEEQPVGVIEAKPVGHTLGGVQVQARKYPEWLPDQLSPPRRPLPFVYSSTGVETRMLRQQHYKTATAFFGTTEFHRLFVVHALDESVRQEICPGLANRRIHWLTVRELVADLLRWYENRDHRAPLSHTFMG